MKLTFLKDVSGINCSLSFEKNEAVNHIESLLLGLTIKNEDPIFFELKHFSILEEENCDTSEIDRNLFMGYLPADAETFFEHLSEIETIIIRHRNMQGQNIDRKFNGEITISGELLEKSLTIR